MGDSEAGRRAEAGRTIKACNRMERAEGRFRGGRDLVTMDVGHEGEGGVQEALEATTASSLRSLPEASPCV